MWTDQGLPFVGRTPRSRQASYSGARVAARGRGVKVRWYLRLLKIGPHTDREAACALDQIVAGVSSICSIRNALKDAGLVEAGGHVLAPTGAKNTRWRLTSAGRAAVEEMMTA